MKRRWVVFDSVEGVLLTTDNYSDALETYERYKKLVEDGVDSEGEFMEDERVILAEVKRDFYAYDTGHKNYVKDEDGNLEEDGTLWNLKEDVSEF